MIEASRALDWFDGLGPVSLDEMTGQWVGEAVPTGHPLDAMLAAARWWGKRFDGPEDVHPLVHRGLFGGRYCVNPALLPLGLGTLLPVPLVALTFPLLRPFIATRKPRARLRMVEHRGVVTATMVYDAKPINDVFRRIDAQSVLGLMDQRGAPAPFFFRLTRES